MNWLIIIGIAVIGFGTYLIYLGSDRTNKKSQDEIINKIKQTQAEIKNIKDSSNTDSIKSKITEVEDEFHKWADEFLKNKQSKKLSIEKQKISSIEGRIKVSNIWLPGFRAFVNVIKNSIPAYSEKTGIDIQCDLPKIPEDILINSTKPYLGNIIFSPNVFWEIVIYPPEKFDKEYSPKLNIMIYSENVSDKKISFKYDFLTDWFSIYALNSILEVYSVKNTRFNPDYLKNRYEFTNPEETLREMARDLFEAQLLQL